MELQTSRLILRPFRDDDIARLAELMANPDFMRFSLVLTRASKHEGSSTNFFPGRRLVYLRRLQLFFGEILRFLVTAVFFITLKCPRRSKLVTDSIPTTGIVV
jgi:RimJ/RimL family protein N-acetyltransferase